MKYIQYIQSLKKQKNQGFTLIELLVVIIIIGVLSAIAIPSFIGQVGKARETDAKNYLGTIARSQQAYHFEKRNFANDTNNLNIGGINTRRYYNYPNPNIANSNIVKHQAIAINPFEYIVKNYAVGVYHTAGSFDIALCQGSDINVTVDVGDDINDNCNNNGVRLK